MHIQHLHSQPGVSIAVNARDIIQFPEDGTRKIMMVQIHRNPSVFFSSCVQRKRSVFL